MTIYRLVSKLTAILIMMMLIVGCAAKQPNRPLAVGKIPIPSPPQETPIEGAKAVSPGETYKAQSGGGICFTKEGYESLRQRDQMRDYYTSTLRQHIEMHNAEVDRWLKELK